jgi:predicted transcriptional regulator
LAVKKASFNLPDEELEQLRQLAAERNVTVTQALRQAIADSSFIQEQVREKNKLLVEKKDGSIREISVHR